MFPVMLEEIRKAKKFVFLEYFILDDGKMLKLKNENLTKKESDEIIAKRITQKDINKNQNKSTHFSTFLTQKMITSIIYSVIK